MARGGKRTAFGAFAIACAGLAAGVAFPRAGPLAEHSLVRVRDVLSPVLGPAPPNVAWPRTTPGEAGLDPQAVARLERELVSHGTRAFVLVRHGRIVAEFYAADFDANTPHGLAAAAKGLVGSLALGLATELGVVDPDAPVAQCIPGWERREHAGIRIRHLASHSSGIEDVPFVEDPEGLLPSWMRTYFHERPLRFRLALERARVLDRPGSRLRYSGTGYYVLAWCIARSLERTDYETMGELLRARAMEPLGIPDAAWSIGYREVVERDGLRLQAIGSGASMTARAAARIGQLYLREGVWEGQRILRAETVRAHTAGRGAPAPDRSREPHLPIAGYGWWLNRDGNFEALPRDAYFAEGMGAETVLVVPSWDLVMVRFGRPLVPGAPSERQWDQLGRYVFTPVARTVAVRGAAAATRRRDPRG